MPAPGIFFCEKRRIVRPCVVSRRGKKPKCGRIPQIGQEIAATC
jgi:hypothetical protein